jgi:translation elongation factor EF-G
LQEDDTNVEFANEIVGSAIPSNYIPAVEKGFREAANSGGLIGFPVEVSDVKRSWRRLHRFWVFWFGG